MRIFLSVVFGVMIAMLGVCTFLAERSKKPIGKQVALLVSALIPPVAGNLLIIASPYETLSTVGCYIYFIGMDVVMFAVVNFLYAYCSINRHNKLIKSIIYIVLVLDAIQILINVLTHHVFTMEQIEAYGSIYFRFIPGVGLYIHRVVDYSILAGVLVVLILYTIFTPRVYKERYLVILLAMVAVAAWQTFYIFSRTPVDISMTGFGAFGLLVFILALYYRPLKLLDRMLAVIASRMNEALFFFDTNDRCIWANNKALEMLSINENELFSVTPKLVEKIGKYANTSLDWSKTVISGTGENMVSYVVERQPVVDRNKVVGSYILVRDNSSEQKALQKETYNATHDPLTKALNRAGYDAKMSEIDLRKTFLILFDLDAFKMINDDHGHNIGDQVLFRIVEIITQLFRKSDYICRIGGDEFAIILTDANPKTPEFAKERIDAINQELIAHRDELPLPTISAGGAFGKDAENEYELFNNADHALYVTKFHGKCGFTLFEKR